MTAVAIAAASGANTATAAERSGAAPSAPAQGWSWSTWIALIWFTGVAMMTAVLMAGLSRLVWLERRARVVRAGAWYDAAQALASEYGMEQVKILQSDHPTLLVTWGLFEPKVILPATAPTWTVQRVRLVLRHELTHIRRGDWVPQLVAEIVKALHWYNPLVWIACRRLRTESELACDAALMSEGLPGPEYAAELLELARSLNAPRASWTAALAMARPSSLEGRVTAMLTEHLDRAPLERKNRAAAVAAALVIATLLAGLNVFAQAFSTLSGAVLDQHGGIIPRGSLTLASQDADRSYQVKSDGSGQYQFVGVVPGEYVLSAQIPGFKDGRTKLTIAGANLRRDLSLTVGTLQETITVAHGSGTGTAARPEMDFVPAPPPAAKPACDNTVPSGRISPPTKVKDVRPVYPSSMAAVGVVKLDARIGTDGTVVEAKSTDPSVDSDLAAAAIAAVRQWRFTPTLLNCVPVEVEMAVLVNFRGE